MELLQNHSTQERNEYLDETQAYVNEEERCNVVWELLVYAHMLYSRVYVFKNFDAYAKSFEIDPRPEEYWEGLSRERLIDEIKVCTAFENYNKAVLLSRGFIVHLIDAKTNRTFAKQQKNFPIPITDFLAVNQFTRKNGYEKLYLEGFRNFNTISFGLTLSDQYQTVIGLDHKFLGYLKKLNAKRNRLHYYKNYAGSFRVQSHLDAIAFAKSHGLELIKTEIEKVKDQLRKFD